MQWLVGPRAVPRASVSVSVSVQFDPRSLKVHYGLRVSSLRFSTWLRIGILERLLCFDALSNQRSQRVCLPTMSIASSDSMPRYIYIHIGENRSKFTRLGNSTAYGPTLRIERIENVGVLARVRIHWNDTRVPFARYPATVSSKRVLLFDAS